MEKLPILIRIIILAVWLFGIPMVVGNCLRGMAEDAVGKNGAKPVFFWIGGQILLWGGFQLIAVPMIIKMRRLSELEVFFLAYTAVMSLGGTLVAVKQRLSRRRLRVLRGREDKKRMERTERVCWALFAALLLLQLVLAVGMTYADGDDAYYVAVSGLADSSDTMYQILPYTGGRTGVDSRHGLAPFPVWISFLARVSGIPVTIIAHVAVQLMLIPMTYGIFYLLGRRLLPGKKGGLPLFMVFAELLVIFGGVSIYTTEHFMLARSRQGKTVLCSIVIPLILWLLLLLYEKLQEGKRCGWIYWLFLLAVTITGCLCSTIGAVLICILLGLGGLCGAVYYRRCRVLFPIFGCCVPCMLCAALYFVMK